VKIRIIIEDDLDAIQGYSEEEEWQRAAYMKEVAKALQTMLEPNSWGKMTLWFETETTTDTIREELEGL